jgi:hypothetical protein
MGLTPEQAVAKAERLYKQLVPRAVEAVELNAFYEGEQPLAYASEQWKAAHRERYKGFSDNWCETVANAPVERESIIGFRLPSSTKVKQSRAEKALWSAWIDSEQDAQSLRGFLGATVARRSFCQVWGDSQGEPIITWKPATQAIVTYDAETGRSRTAALVIWDDEEDGFEFATLYTPEEVWKFRRQRLFKTATATGFVVPASVILSESGGWELTPENSYGRNHLGKVPVVEITNRRALGGEPLSDIKGTVSMQNAINMLWAYAFNAADFASMPARVVMGQEPPKIPILDDNGQKIGEKPVDQKALTEGRMLWLTGQNTTIGKWEAASLAVFTDVIERAVRHIAAQTRTPQHYLLSGSGVSNLSAEAITGLEEGLVQKVESATKEFRPRIRDVFELIAIQLGDDKAAREARHGDVQFQRPGSRSDAQEADAFQKDVAAGYPFEYLLEKYGYGAPDIARIMEMRQRESEQALGFAAQQALTTDLTVSDAANAA